MAQVHQITCEAEVIPGLEAFAAEELNDRFRQRVEVEASSRDGLLPFVYSGELGDLLELDSVLAVYGIRNFPIPRPKALLGNAEWDIFQSMIDTVLAIHARGTFETFRISAAGEDSSVMVRIREQLAARTGLAWVADEGDLLIRMRRPLDGGSGWEVLLRLSPRPLSVRSWRVCNLPGALNATVARAMGRLSRPNHDDLVLNLGCGSGTLLIERLRLVTARITIGCDESDEALICAASNVKASGYDDIRLERWDLGAMPMPDNCVDSVLIDLPFGQLVGSHAANQLLYPRVLDEAARVTVPGGLLIAITEDVRRWERMIGDRNAAWQIEDVIPIKIPFAGGYLHPRIYRLVRQS
ncbi:MAG: methyltransferase domain-containing protein [Herpetosiphon sp.]